MAAPPGKAAVAAERWLPQNLKNVHSQSMNATGGSGAYAAI
jgi:hypothetical protein